MEFPPILSHSLNPPRLMITKSQYFSSPVCTCEYLSACKTRQHYQVHSERKSLLDCDHAALAFLRQTDGGQTESISRVYFRDAAVTDENERDEATQKG